MNIFGGGGFNGIRGVNIIEREMKKQSRRAVEKLAENIHPNLGKVVRVVSEFQEVNDDDYYRRKVLDSVDELKEGLMPIYGSVVYCELGFGAMEHSGIYIGGNQIINLDGKGNIQKVSCKEFSGNITTLDTSICVPCDRNGQPVGIGNAARRAEEMVGEKRNYNLIFDNCHQFSSGCINGNFENADNFLWMLKDTFAKFHGDKIIWKKWNWR